MRIYQASTNGLWIGIVIFVVMLFSIVALGGFLLGTPLGLAVLTLLVIRHYYKKHQRKRYQEAYEGTFGGQGFTWFGNQGQTDASDASDWQAESEPKVYSDDFASQYKQAEQDIKTFSTEDKYNAVDVEYKEI